jgi:hypothetical protein
VGGSRDSTLFYGEEVFTFFLSGAPPDEQLELSSSAAGRTKGSDLAAAAADNLVIERQVELSLHQTWRTCKALREHHDRVAAVAEGTVVTTSTYGNEFRRPLVVVACSSQNEKNSQAPEKQRRRVSSSFDCEAQAEALRRAFKNSLSSSSSSSSSNDGSREKRSEDVEVDVVTWRGGPALRDQAAYELLQRAAVLVSEDSEDMLLGLLGHSNHPLSYDNAAQELPPALAVAYWHFNSPAKEGADETDDTSAAAPASRLSTPSSSPSLSLPYRARALAAAGIDVWPMFVPKVLKNRESRSSDTTTRELERVLTSTVTAALAQWQDGSHGSSSSSSSSSSDSGSSSSSSSSSGRGHGGRRRGDRNARQGGEREGKEWFEWRQASLAAHGGPQKLEAHVANLPPAIVRLGPVTDRDLFGAYLEATFGGESTTTSNRGSSDSESSSSSSSSAATDTFAVSHSENKLRGGLRRGSDGNSQPTTAAVTQVGIEVGPEIGDFAAQVLQKWSSCRGYILVDDVISEADSNAGGGKLNSNAALRAKVFAFLLISKEYVYSIGWVWIALKI